MGHVYVDARVAARRTANVRFLVDTGATWTILPPSLVHRVGAPILPRTVTVRLADGRKRRVRACTILLRIGDREGVASSLVMQGSEPLLGVEALEGLGLKVNPSKGRLEPTRAAAGLLVGARRR